MNAKQEISKVGIAIERARSIIDEAMPREHNPFLPDYEYARLAPLFALAHWGIENGLKALIQEVEGTLESSLRPQLEEIVPTTKGQSRQESKVP